MNREKAIAYLAKVASKREREAELRAVAARQLRGFIRAKQLKQRPHWTIHRELSGMYVVRDQRRVGVARFHVKKAARRFIELNGAINATNFCTK